MTTDPLRIVGNLTLDAVLDSDESITLIKAEDLAELYSEPTQTSLSHLTTFPLVAWLTFPATPDRPAPDRLLLPLSQTGYGQACFLHALNDGTFRLGRPRALSKRTGSAVAEAAAALLGWTDFVPKPRALKRAKRTRFYPHDRNRRDLPIYLTILEELGEPVPSTEEMETTPICELLAALHARVIEKNPLRLIDLVANGRNGAIAEHVSKFREFFPSTEVCWIGGQPRKADDGSDNSAYCHLLGDIYTCLINGRKGKSNWLKLFDPAKAGIVKWINDKVEKIALRQINCLKQGSRVLTPDHSPLEENERAAAMIPDTALAFGPSSFDPTEQNQAAVLAKIGRYLGRMYELNLVKRREAFAVIGDLVESSQLDRSEHRGELEYMLVEARERFLGVAAVGEGSADLVSRAGGPTRDQIRETKNKLVARNGGFAPCKFSADEVDPYAQPVAPHVEPAAPKARPPTAEVWEKMRKTLRETRPKRRKPKAEPDQFLLFPDSAEPVPSAMPKARPEPRATAKSESAPAVQVGLGPRRSVPQTRSTRRVKQPDPNQTLLALVFDAPLPSAPSQAAIRPQTSTKSEFRPPIPFGFMARAFSSQSAQTARPGNPPAARRPRSRSPTMAVS